MLSSQVDRKVLIISTSVFLVMLGAGIIGPVLPKYAGSFGVSYAVVGLTISAFGLARIIFDVPSGSLSDRVGRRPLIVSGILVFAVTGLLAAYAENIYHLVFARFLQGVGAAVFTTSAMAYVADVVPVSSRGRYLGYYQSSFFLGTAVGPALGGFLTGLGGIRMPFLALSALSLIAALFAYASLAGAEARATSRGRGGTTAALARMLTSRSAMVANLAAIVTFLMIGGIRITAIPFYGDYLKFSELQIGLVLSEIALINFIAIRWSGALVDKFGRKWSLFYGFVFAGVFAQLFTYSFDFASMMLVGAFFGVSTSFILPAQATLAVDASDPNHRGLSLGVYRIFSDIGIILGPLATGELADRFDLRAPYSFVAAISIAMAAVAITLRERARSPPPLGR